jgi:hypothetical protein
MTDETKLLYATDGDTQYRIIDLQYVEAGSEEQWHACVEKKPLDGVAAYEFLPTEDFVSEHYFFETAEDMEKWMEAQSKSPE